MSTLDKNRLPKNVKLIENPHPDAGKRFLVWSETRGVFLGDKCWSYDPEAKNHNAAVTYNGEVIERVVKHFREKNGVEDAKEIECYPDLLWNCCSNEAVANAGLPRWEFDEKKYPILDKHRKRS